MSTNPPLFIFITDADCHAAFKWFGDQPWCRGVIVPLGSELSSLIELARRPWEIICQLPGHPQTLAFQMRCHNLPVPDAAASLQRVHDAIGDRLIWLGLVEEDSSGVAFPQALLREKPRTHEAAYVLLKQRLSDAIKSASSLPSIRLASTAGFASSLHAQASLGLDHLTLERTNDDVDDLQTGIAFCRGAARQFDVPVWGIDFSLWWGVIVGPGYLVQKLPSSFHRRNLYASAFSGAQALIMEGMARGKDCVDPDHPPALAQAVEEVGHLFLNYKPGEVEVPVAVMLPEDHGWMTRPYWQGTRTMCSYAHVPCRPGDRGIDGFFGYAFPASTCAMDPFPFGNYQSNEPPATPFGLSCIEGIFAPSPEDEFDALPYLPFGRFENRAKANAAFVKDNIDPADYRPMATSRWGDVLDVFTTSVSGELLEKYPVLILLGAIKLTDALTAKLKQYVKDGGQLILSAGVATPNSTALTGLKLEPEMRVGRAWSWQGDRAVHEAFRYLPCKVAMGACVLASTPCGSPLVVQHKLGKGSVCTTTIPWFESAHHDCATLCTRMWDHAVGQVQPVTIDGLPVQWISTKDANNDRHVMVINHDASPWQGTVKLRDAVGQASEVLTKRSLEVSGTDIKLTIAPYDLAIIHTSD